MIRLSTLLILPVLFFGDRAHSAVLETFGTLVRCDSSYAVKNEPEAWTVGLPQVRVQDDTLVIQLAYLFRSCQEKEGDFQLAPVTEVNPDYRLLILSPRLFSLVGVMSSWPKPAMGVISVEIPLKWILSEDEFFAYSSGEKILKKLDLYNGTLISGADPELVSSYRHSGGGSVLEFVLLGRQVWITEFLRQ